MEHYKYPKTKELNDFADKSKEIVREINPMHVGAFCVNFSAFEKIHGTNTSVVFIPKTGEMYAQSRNRVLSKEEDHFGFHKYFVDHLEDLSRAFKVLYRSTYKEGDSDAIVMFGEWCGKGIANGTAVNLLDEKVWVIFDIIRYNPDGSVVWSSNSEIETVVYYGKNSNLNFSYPLHRKSIILNLSKITSEDKDTIRQYAEEIGEVSPLIKGMIEKDGNGEGLVYKGNVDGVRLQFKVKASNFKERGSRKVDRENSIDSDLRLLAIQLADEFILADTLSKDFQNNILLNLGNIPEFVRDVRIAVRNGDLSALDISEQDKRKIIKIVGNIAADYYRGAYYDLMNDQPDPFELLALAL